MKILLTGGTGSFGKAFVKYAINNYEQVRIYSRDELKQYEMKMAFDDPDDKLRFFIGDVKDYARLKRACHGVDVIIHAAAQKQVPSCEYNPFEAIKTNINGAQNVVDVALDCGVKKVIALSTDKGVDPINLYGATKLCSDKLIIAANAYSGKHGTVFSVVRYGNVMGSRGSVLPLYRKIVGEGKNELPVTDERMTRFWITLDEAVGLVNKAITESVGGEIYVKKLKSFYITDLVKAFGKTVKIIGVRGGEKLHEKMITQYDKCYDYGDYFIIYPQNDWYNERKIALGGKDVSGLNYESDKNEFLTVDEIRGLIGG